MIKSKVYTSYFGNMNNLPEDAILISIANKTPSWFKGISWRNWLAPDWDLVKELKAGNISQEVFKDEYTRQTLRNLPDADFIEELLGKDKTYILLCYEKPEAFCHRHLFADWANRMYGWDIKEYIVGKQIKLF